MSLFALLVACTSPAPWDGPVLTRPRTALTVEQLQAFEPLEPVDTSFLALPEDHTGEPEPLVGTLTFLQTRLQHSFPGGRPLYNGEATFPYFSVGLVSQGNVLMPATTGRIATAPNSAYDALVGPGAVWHEDDDGAYSRATLPIDLMDRYFNRVHNCLLSFVYEDGVVGPAHVQCTQETADAEDDQVGDLWGPVSLSFEPGEVQPAIPPERLPTRPLSELDPDGRFAEIFDAPRLTRAPTSVGAVYADGTLYVHPQATRHGPHPFPDGTHHGVYSVTKSLAGSLAMLHLAERYGDELFQARITDHVPELADAPGWEGVTFANALDMATGTDGGERVHQLFQPLVLADTVSDALAGIAALGDAPPAPGERFQYATTHTFVLSAALQGYVGSREGPGVKAWDLVQSDVLDPLGVGELELLQTREPEPAEAIPLLGFGARPTLDQAARIARLFAAEGEHEGVQLLHREGVRRLLGRTGDAGLPAGGRKRYRSGFWARSVRVGGCKVEATWMQGHGGNHIVLLPSGLIVIRFMDEGAEDVVDLVRAAESIRSSCP